MCCFIVEPPLDNGFEMDRKANVVVWHSDIVLFMLKDCLLDFEDHPW
jgi:hypothetical protein